MSHCIRALLFVAGLLVAGQAFADQNACDAIRAGYIKTGSAGGQRTDTGYAFAKDTAKLYGSGDHTCSYVRDESVDGHAAVVYREQYRSSAGSTDATIWISKSTGKLLREEQEGDFAGKGKGHIAYHWAP